MLIKVRTLTGKEIELDIELDYKVSQIKEKVEEKEGIPPVQQRLIHGGKQMTDDKTAAEYNLVAGDTLHLVLALRGGRQKRNFHSMKAQIIAAARCYLQVAVHLA
ncbi:hypothetical protein TgHK011_002964 [Trichoderma gracile]|nr:hypothetical protein TgHK011_002964 [Trichoderma gracile]